MDKLNINLFVEYTKCNMNCPYCYVKDTSKDIDDRGAERLRKFKEALAALPYRISVAIEQNGDALISDKMLQFISDLSWCSNMEGLGRISAKGEYRYAYIVLHLSPARIQRL